MTGQMILPGRVGPTLCCSPAYMLVLQPEAALAAQIDVITWADRVHRAAELALTPPRQHLKAAL